MDKNRFDGFTRQLAKRENRRQALKTLFAGAAGTAAALMIGKETEAANRHRPPSIAAPPAPRDSAGSSVPPLPPIRTTAARAALPANRDSPASTAPCSPVTTKCKKAKDCPAAKLAPMASARHPPPNAPPRPIAPPANVMEPRFARTGPADTPSFRPAQKPPPKPHMIARRISATARGISPRLRSHRPSPRPGRVLQDADLQRQLTRTATRGEPERPRRRFRDGSGACVECVTPADCAGGTLPNATVTCNANTCGYTCNAGYSDCSGGVLQHGQRRPALRLLRHDLLGCQCNREAAVGKCDERRCLQSRFRRLQQ